MTTAELIAKLQETDPSGEAEVLVNVASGWEYEIDPGEPSVNVCQVHRAHASEGDRWTEWRFDEFHSPSYCYDRVLTKHAVVVG